MLFRSVGFFAARPLRALEAIGAVIWLVGFASATQDTCADGVFMTTVSKTDQLVNEVIKVDWTGGVPTSGQANFLQIMQCWGDDAAGPSREQCQFGGLQNQLGGWASTRQVYYGGSLSDTNETYVPPVGYVPFHPVNGATDVPEGNTNQFYDQYTTNEIARGITYRDGTGEEFFQVQTGREAPGLGCGNIVTSAVNGSKARHKCWLVVVPRAGDELPGINHVTSGGVLTSPLSVTNWAQRIVIPLNFQNLGDSCPIDATEVPTYGTELMTNAMSSWQPALCQQADTVYSFTQVPDDLARTTAITGTGDEAGIGFVGQSIPAQTAGTAKLIYAPLTISGLGIAFLINQQSLYGAPADVVYQNGRLVSDIKLTPRLVAKLLTQSYMAGNPPGNPALLQSVKVAGKTQPVTQPLLAARIMSTRIQ